MHAKSHTYTYATRTPMTHADPSTLKRPTQTHPSHSRQQPPNGRTRSHSADITQRHAHPATIRWRGSETRRRRTTNDDGEAARPRETARRNDETNHRQDAHAEEGRRRDATSRRMRGKGKGGDSRRSALTRRAAVGTQPHAPQRRDADRQRSETRTQTKASSTQSDARQSTRSSTPLRKERAPTEADTHHVRRILTHLHHPSTQCTQTHTLTHMPRAHQ